MIPKGYCFYWEPIERVLSEGPATCDELTPAIYGLDTEAERRATKDVMKRLITAGRVVRIKAGLWALPDRTLHHNPFGPDALIAFMTPRGRTIDEIADHFGISPQWASKSIKRLGVRVVSRRAPRSRWAGSKPCSTYRIARDARVERGPLVRPRPSFQEGVPDGRYRCPACGEVKPLDDEHFYIRFSRVNRGRTTGYCRPCQKEYARRYKTGEHQRWLAQRRAVVGSRSDQAA